MHKLVILIHASDTWQKQEGLWPEFLHLVESMPGLRREAACKVERFLLGGAPAVYMHELFFDNQAEAEKAMASPQGAQAGALLQRMTGGRMTLFFADHKEDDLANIQKFRQADETEQ